MFIALALALLNGFFGASIASIVLLCLFFPSKGAPLFPIRGVIPSFFSIGKLNLDSLDESILTVLNQKLEGFLTNLKSELPMASLFIRGNLEQKLKDLAREEFLGAIPKIKETILDNFLNPQSKTHQALKSLFIRYSIKMAFFAFIVGFLLGLFEYFLISNFLWK